MVALDYPQQTQQDSPFEHRYALLLESISPSHPFIVSPTKSFSSSPLTYFDGIYINVPTHACVDTKYAKQVTKVLLECGSEGSVVRAPKSPYQQGRSEALIKFKVRQPPISDVLLYSVIYSIITSRNLYHIFTFK